VWLSDWEGFDADDDGAAWRIATGSVDNVDPDVAARLIIRG
jgi:hypothetical protein